MILKSALLIAATVLLTSCGTLTMQPARAPNAMDTTVGRYRAEDADRYIIVTMTDAVHEQLVRGERVDREGELPPAYAGFLANLARTYKLKRVADWPLSSLAIRCFVFEVPDAAQRDSTITALTRERFVESAQRLSSYFTSSEAPAKNGGDPYRNLQHGFNEMQVGAAQRWATGRTVKVAVIDTGLDTKHPDLRERVVGIRNFVDRNIGAFNADVHGTAMAGVIAATSNNGVGLTGVAPEAEILGFKACWQTNPAQSATCSSFTLAKAVNFAIDASVDVINLSLGGPPDPLLTRLVDKALERNIVVVGAVSPDWPNGWPAGVNGVIGVTNKPAPGSAAISAPGNQVLSTKPQREYDFFTGSSLSTAHVAGLAALIRQRKPHLPANTVKELIVSTAEPDSHAANACRALARVVDAGNCESAMPR